MRHQAPVIIFGSGIAAYGVIRALSQYDIPIYMVSGRKGISVRSRFVKGFLLLDPRDENCIAKLNSWFTHEIGADAVLMVAGSDFFLDTLAKGHNDILPGMKPTFPSWEVVVLVREKIRSYDIAKDLGIPIPETYYITCRSELQSLIDEGFDPEFPLLMKAEDSQLLLREHRIKGVICNNIEAVMKNYEKYNGFYGKLLLQEMVPGGEEHLLNLLIVLNKGSQPIGVFINKKRRSSREFLACTLMTSTWSDEVLDYSLKLLKRIGYYGYANVEYKLDERAGLLKLMEINGRITMSNSHALRCGINLPYLMYKDAIEDSPSPLDKFKQTYPEDILWWCPAADISYIYNSVKNRAFNLSDYIKATIGRGYIIEPMSWRDPCPGLYSMMEVLHRARKMFFHGIFKEGE